MTDANRSSCGIKPIDLTRTRVPVPDTFPRVTLQPVSSYRVKIFVKQSEDENGVSKRGKPKGVKRFEVVYEVGTAVVTDVTACSKTRQESKNPLALTFLSTQAGLKLTVYARWMNNRNEGGPWSAVQTAIVPG